MKLTVISEIIATEFVIYYVLHKFLDYKFNKKILLCPVATILVIVVSIIFKNDNMIFYTLNFLPIFLLYFLLPCIIMSAKKHLSIIIGIVGSISLINSILTLLLSMFYVSELIYTLCRITFNAAIILFAVLFSLNKNNILHVSVFFNVPKKLIIIMDIYIWELFVLISVLDSLFLEYPHKQIANIVTILIIISMIISFISFFFLISSALNSAHYQNLNKFAQKNIDEQITYYNRLSQYNSDLRRFKHDYDNLKLGLLAQLNEGNIDKAIKYLNDCSDMITPTETLYHTGHPIIDSLLFDKASQIKDKNITINFNGIFPQNPMNTADLCAVFGNIIDNAIRACTELPEKQSKNIEIFLKQHNDYLFVTFMNPVLNDLVINNNLLSTTKENKDEHGIGLFSVRKTLKKYDGHLTLSCADKVFTTKLDFRIIPE